MQRLVFIGSHLGYPMDKTPLGGGAMVGQALSLEWAKSGEFKTAVLGAGSESPAPEVEYVRLGSAAQEPAPDLVSFSEMAYARFCRVFERETTQWLLSRRGQFPPESTAVVVNDISEGPDLQALRAAGYKPVSLWHVDVADYFCRIYLRKVVSAEQAVGFYEGLVRHGADKFVPEVLRLVFEKQRRTAMHSERMIFPSRAMAEIVGRCYPWAFKSEAEFQKRALVIPWGAWENSVPLPTASSVEALKDYYQIGPQSLVVMTLSRLAPEKGVHLLIEALAELERQGDFKSQDVCLFVCGAPAFMRGAAYTRRVRQAAQKLRRTRVFFPGYLGPQDKQSFFRLAQLFVSPSVHESYGLNAMEAMRAGLPILALQHYGSRDWPQEDFACVVSPETDGGAVSALTQGLQKMLTDRPKLEMMGRRAAKFAAAQPFSKAAQRVADAAFSALSKNLPSPVLN